MDTPTFVEDDATSGVLAYQAFHKHQYLNPGWGGKPGDKATSFPGLPLCLLQKKNSGEAKRCTVKPPNKGTLRNSQTLQQPSGIERNELSNTIITSEEGPTSLQRSNAPSQTWLLFGGFTV